MHSFLKGYKLVSIAASSFSFNADDLHLPYSLREVAYWYPTIPDQSLYLNEKSFTGEHVLETDYMILSWLHFGGTKGAALKHIKRIEAAVRPGVEEIEVDYNDEDIGWWQRDDYHARRRLGRCGLPSSMVNWSHYPYLDSAGGERIESVVAVENKNVREIEKFMVPTGTLGGLLVSFRCFH